MAATNPFKSFIPYVASIPNSFDPVAFEIRPQDPSGGLWRTVHIAAPMKGEGAVVDLSGSARLMAVQFNERILPGKVRDEELRKKVAALEAAEGRSIGKKEYAQLREQAEFDLLPRAFIRRTSVAVLFMTVAGKPMMLVCTSSQKRADDATYVLRATFGESWNPWKAATKGSVRAFLTHLSTGSVEDQEDDSSFFSLDSAVFKGEDKETFRIKDKQIDSGDVQALLKGEMYHATEMGVGWCADAGAAEDQHDIEYVATEGMIFKRIVVPGIKPTMQGEDFHGFAVLCAQQYKAALASFIAANGGLREPPAPVAATKFTSDDEI